MLAVHERVPHLYALAIAWIAWVKRPRAFSRLVSRYCGLGAGDGRKAGDRAAEKPADEPS
ncbi:MAG TPA: hypothetical protein VFO57_12580 [Burkholderiales bacterium]|nr:hypothetical protein [Burkholderiales bacterium]